MPAAAAEAAVLDAADEDAVALGEPDRAAQPAGDVGRRDAPRRGARGSATRRAPGRRPGPCRAASAGSAR